MLELLGIVGGLALLTLAADQFVLGAARVAGRLGWSTVLIGAIVIGFGTSAPEIVVSGLAAAQGSLGLAVGNVIGSNIANLSLVLGAAAMVTPLTVESPTLRREVPVSIGAVAVFGFAVQGGLGTAEGVGMLVLLGVVLGGLALAARGDDTVLDTEVADYLATGAGSPLQREVLRTLLGLVGTVVAAQVLVAAATGLADRLGLSDGFVGLTIVAIGTSLPELATSLTAARRDETDLIIGNLLGSNIFNALAVGGVAAVAGAGPIDDDTLTGAAILLMLAVAVIAAVAMWTRRTVGRSEGALLLGVWLVSLPLFA